MTSFERIASINVKDYCTMYNPDKKLELGVFFVVTYWTTATGAKHLTTRHQYSDFAKLDNSLWKLIPSYAYSYAHPKPYAPAPNLNTKEDICSSFTKYINSLFTWCATFESDKNKAKIHETFNAFLSNDSLAGVVRCAELTPTEHDYMLLRDIYSTCGGSTEMPLFPCPKYLVSMFGADSGILSDWLWKMGIAATYLLEERSPKYIFVESLPEQIFARMSADYAFDESLSADGIASAPRSGSVWVSLGKGDTYARFSNILRGLNDEQCGDFATVVVNERYLDIVVRSEYSHMLKNVVTLFSPGESEWTDQDKVVVTALVRSSAVSVFLHDSNKFDCTIKSADIVVPNLKHFVECQLSAASCQPAETKGKFFVPEGEFILKNGFFALTRLDETVQLDSQDFSTKLKCVNRKFNSVINNALLSSVEGVPDEMTENRVPSHNLGLLLWMPKDGLPVPKELEYIREVVRAKVTNDNLNRKMNRIIMEYAGYLLNEKRYSTWLKWLIGADKQVKRKIEEIKSNAEKRLYAP